MEPSKKDDNTNSHEEDGLLNESRQDCQLLLIGCFCMLAFSAGISKSIQLAIIVPESLKIHVSPTEAELILAAFHVSSLPTLLLQPSLNKWRKEVFAAIVGLAGLVAFGVFYFAPYMKGWYLYVAVIARLVGGTSYYLICNKIIVGMARIFKGNVSNSSVAWDVAVTAGNAIGAYLGPLLVRLVGFSMTMVVCACIILKVAIVLGLAFPQQDNTNKEAKRSIVYTHSLKLHFRPDLIAYGWGPQLGIGACMVFVEGNIIYFYMKEYKKSYGFGGVVLGASSIVYSLTSFISGYIGKKKPAVLPGIIAVGLISAGIQLIFMGPVFTISDTVDLGISVTSFNLLLLSSSALQYATLTLCARKLSEQVGPEEAMSAAMNVWYMAYNIGACIGPLIAGALMKYIGFRMDFAVGTPFLLFFALLPCLTKMVS